MTTRCLRTLLLTSIAALFMFTVTPKHAHASRNKAAWVATFSTVTAITSLITTVISFNPSSFNTEQHCNYGTSSACCDAPLNAVPSWPTNCNFQNVSAGVCPQGQTLYCPGANQQAPTRYS